ncbi:MAG: sulfite exporter TauE/SafE family protein [Chryseotalea sp.]|jgi:uncharacterized membrane protein YfcA
MDELTSNVLLVCVASFAAGFTDAIVGGGGLIQTPVLFLAFPQYPAATLLGTTKIPSFSGTAISLLQFARHVKLNWKILFPIALSAFLSAMLGSSLVRHISNENFKPIILLSLCAVAVYTYRKKSLGVHKNEHAQTLYALPKAVVCGLLIGFYDGFIGPGTGSFLVLVFVSVLGFDFLHASAHAKTVNLATNAASILYFITTGNILWWLALPMAIANMSGGFFGTKLALLKGNVLVRKLFLTVIFLTIVRFAYDVIF